MTTEFLFRSDAYRVSAPAHVVALTEGGGVMLDQTVFYANSGGQPGDRGVLEFEGSDPIDVADAIHPDRDKSRIVHIAAPGAAMPAIGAQVTAIIDWDRRYRLMRMHTALHLLSVVMPFPVTGGSVSEEKGRLDFDMPEVPNDLAGLEERLNALIVADHPVTSEWITDDEMRDNQDLIKTMNVKPPMGQGRVRLVRIGDVDLQPCGGTHVARTSEIGAVKFGKIEKKGAQNRRVTILFA